MKCLCSAFDSRMASSGVKKKKKSAFLLSFFFIKRFLQTHPCHVLICRVAAPSVEKKKKKKKIKEWFNGLHEKCMTLFVSCRTRETSGQFYQSRAHFPVCMSGLRSVLTRCGKLIVLYFLFFDNCNFFRAVLKHIVTLSMKRWLRFCMGSCVSQVLRYF